MYQYIFKRLLDFSVSLSLLIILFPIFLLVGFAIAISMGLPIFFTQDRPGKDGKIFKILKFRTMTVIGVNKSSLEAKEENRITKLGKFLRSTSLDEIPELINVIRGEMSLVGPRPLLTEYLSCYSQEQMKRHNVLPGVTGLAQAKGRNSLKWNNKFRYDVFYVNHLSFMFDLYILFMTVLIVVNKKGFNVVGEEQKFGHSVQAN